MALFVPLVMLAAIYNPLFFVSVSMGNSLFTHAIFESDSAAIVLYDYLAAPVFSNIHHPLMGFVALPFSLTAWLLGIFINVVSMFRVNIIYAYATALCLAQGLTVIVSGLLLRRMVRDMTDEYFSKCFLVLFIAACPTLLYSLIVEKYTVIAFYLIVYMYMCHYAYPLKMKTAGFIAASGIMPTNIILLPALFSDIYNRKNALLARIKQLSAAVIAISFLTGSWGELLYMFATSKDFLNYYAKPVDRENIIYYFDFVRSVFLTPDWYYNGLYIRSFISPASHVFNPLMFMIVAVFCAAGVMYGKKRLLIQLSALYILLSAALIAVIGLGTVEGATVLYSLYFSWAFIVMVSYACYRLSKRAGLYTIAVSVFIGVFNIAQLLRMIIFYNK